MAVPVQQNVHDLINSLCRCILKTHREKNKQKWLSSPLKLPRFIINEEECDNRAIIHHLFKISYDLILLRKKDWFKHWESPLSPYCECISHMYSLPRETDREKLISCVDTISSYNDSESLFKFLSILASPSQEIAPISFTDNQSSFTQYPSSLFKHVRFPFQSFTTHYELFDSSNRVFEATPSLSFFTQEFSNTTLFSGLVHTTTSSLNTVLKVPPLSDTPPDPLLRYLEGYRTNFVAPPIKSTPTIESQSDSIFDLVTSFDDLRPPLSWEGPLSDSSYLSESGSANFSKSVDHFLSLLADMSHIDVPNVTRGLPSINHLITQLQYCFDLMDQRKQDINLLVDEIVRSFHNGIYYILHHCQVQIDQLINQSSSQFFLQSTTTNIQLLLDLICSVLSNTNEVYTKGLLLLDCLYNHCINCQGLPLYPLLFGLFRQTIQPYLKFLHQWVFQGITVGSEGFGLVVNEDSLQRRDQEYWSNGFTFTTGGIPCCLSQYETDILTAGKSLNLLYLCYREHHLCNEIPTPPNLILAHSLNQLKEIQFSTQEYIKLTEKLSVELKQKIEIELLEKHLGDMEPVIKKRQLARQAMKELKDEEERLEREEKERKTAYLSLLKAEAEKSKILKEEIEAEEREKDLLEISRNQKRKELEGQVRYQLEEYYQELTRQAELRTIRAQWRAKRFALGALRLHHMQETREREEKELLTYDDTKVVHSTEPHSLESQHLTEEHEEQNYTGLIPEQPTPVPENSLYQLPVHASEHSFPEPPVVITEYSFPEPPVVTDRDSVSDPIVISENSIQLIPHLQDDLPLEEDVNFTKTQKCHASNSTIESILYTSVPLQLYSTTRGNAPRAIIKDILYPINEVDQKSKSPVEVQLTTIQKLMYYGDKENKVDKVKHDVNEYTIEYPSVRPYSSFTTTHPLNKPPYFSSTYILPSPPDLTNIDESIYLFSLPVLIRDCIAYPVLAQATTVSNALVQYFMTELSLKDHFVFLKQHLFLEDGEFSDALCSQLFHQLVYGQSLDQLCSTSFLYSLLTTALEHSMSQQKTLAENLSIKMKYKPLVLSTSSLEALEFLSLDYKSQWPLNIVITTEHIQKYNKVFHFLLQIKRASWILKKVFTVLNLDYNMRGNVSLRQIHAQRQELQHLVTVMENYVSNQLFHLSWREFENKLSHVNSLSELIECHSDYLDTVLSRCLLNKKAKPVLNLIDNAFNAILKFGGQLLLFNCSRMQSLSAIHNSFRENTSLLFKVIQKLVQRGYQPHLEEFLLRLNFNGHYKP